MLTCTNQIRPHITLVYTVWWHGTNVCQPRGTKWGPTCQSSCGMVGPTVMRWTNSTLPCGMHNWGGFFVCCHFAPLLTVVHHSHTIKWQQCWCDLWCGPIRSGHVSPDGVTWLNGGLPRGMGWVRWPCHGLPRGTPVGPTYQVHSFLSPSCTQIGLCPQVVSREVYDQISALDQPILSILSSLNLF
jgi:hypothetical protein